MCDEKTKTVCIVGAGFSGLCAAIKLQKHFPNYNLTIFDINTDFGGTWLTNIYPGCACDIPSHLYSFSFEPNSLWSTQFPSQTEILVYMKSIAEKHGLYKKAKFRHEVKRLEWLEDRLLWKATILEKLDDDKTCQHISYFNYVLSGTGEYHLPNTPEIFEQFKGQMMHTAEWNPEIELEGKTVAIIGSGASAVQIIPEIVDKVGKLISYQRTPPWVVGKHQFTFPSCVRWAFENIPGVRKFYRTAIYLRHEIQYPAFQISGIICKIARPIGILLGRFNLRWNVNDGQLREKLRPNYSFGCSRICLSSDYYPALCKRNVEVVTDRITDVTRASIKTEDREDKIDVLILATGFKVHDYFGPMEIIGRDGLNVLNKWKLDGPSNYLNILSHHMPNLAFLHGPGVDLGHNAGIFTIECQVNWIIQMMKEVERRNALAVAVKQNVENNYMDEHTRDMRNTIWSRNDCGSYYANENGLITIVYPRSQIDYWMRTRKFNKERFEFYGEIE